MLVGSDDSAVNHERLQILVCAKHFHDAKPSAAFAPTVKACVYVVCQLPSSGGKSRQGAPARAIHKTASINCRLSAAVTPLSLALPGNIASILTHLALLKSALVIALIYGFTPQIIANDCEHALAVPPQD